MTAYVYIVECADGTFYTGWTNDLGKRIAAHNAGQGAKYTRSRRPVRLRYYEAFEEKNEAMKREWAFKQLTHEEKRRLFEGDAQ
ncbi:MAG: GIY-YIG nuclease family protein [Schwartzia sp.]|nr:GIY-YIG nuclease family protein [Schwartzia sp. (in: firmicutes)]